MAIENVRRFEERISGDESLQARMKELAGAFDGDRNDPKALFEAVIAPLAAEAGLPYTYDEALEYVAQRDDDEDLSADDLKATAGGVRDVCFVVGFGEVAADIDLASGAACAGIGVGVAVI